VLSSHFWALVCTGLIGQSAGPVHMLSTGLTGGGDRSDRRELSCCSCPVSSGVLHAFVQGELHWFSGSLHVCRGSSLWFFELWFVGLCSFLDVCYFGTGPTFHRHIWTHLSSTHVVKIANHVWREFYNHNFSSSFVLVVCTFCLSFVLSRMCRAVALA
jgi:hypothetical protein